MCLIAFAVRAHPAHPLVVLANRDELHARPTRAAHAWEDVPGAFGGRDLEKGGSWLGVTRAGRLAAVTNVRSPEARRLGASRGALVRDALAREADPAAWYRPLERAGYPAFNLLVGDGPDLLYGNEQDAELTAIPPGVHALSNARLDVSWPKAERARSMLGASLDADTLDVEAAFAILASRAIAPDDALPHTGVPLGLERALSAAFIVGDVYGTRASTVVVFDAGGGIRFFERTFGPGGVETDRVETTL